MKHTDYFKGRKSFYVTVLSYSWVHGKNCTNIGHLLKILVLYVT